VYINILACFIKRDIHMNLEMIIMNNQYDIMYKNSFITLNIFCEKHEQSYGLRV
jgi:hypothetical protein